MQPENFHTKIYSVSQLTEEIQGILEDRFPFIWIEGEISNFSAPASGHYYMVLKDKKSQIRAVMFRMQARYIRYVPENGMKVIAQGRIGVYPPRGEYQVILDYLEPLGVGALAMAFEQLKRRLAEQGLFDEALKRPLPFLPQRIAVITSPTGAAVKDFLKVIGRRFENLDIIVVPVRVQGEEASSDIVKALELVNRQLDVDVIVLTRGGGSLEDLWPFNQEELALCIRKSRIPVVSAVGHEIDLTISDLAADLRAPTPSAAAEMLVSEKKILRNRIDEAAARLENGIKHRLKGLGMEVEAFRKAIKDPGKGLQEEMIHLDDMVFRLQRSVRRFIDKTARGLEGEKRGLIGNSPSAFLTSLRQDLKFKERSLEEQMLRVLHEKRTGISHLERRAGDLGPLSVLNRGYSITMKLPEMGLVRDSADTSRGDRVKVMLSKGELECIVEKSD